jgi:hypothetical protein
VFVRDRVSGVGGGTRNLVGKYWRAFVQNVEGPGNPGRREYLQNENQRLYYSMSIPFKNADMTWGLGKEAN